MNDVSPETRGQRKVKTSLALALFEAMRDHDFPSEVFEDENLSVTLPRRFGLSGVVGEQIQRYRQVTRRRMSASEFEGLVRLVARRSDAEDVFFAVGQSLAPPRGRRLWIRVIPDRGMERVRARVARRLCGFLGGRFVSARRGSHALEAIDDLLVAADPRGRACALVTGLMQGEIERVGLSGRASHMTCVAQGEEVCSWDIASVEPAGVPDGSSEGEGAGANDTVT